MEELDEFNEAPHIVHGEPILHDGSTCDSLDVTPTTSTFNLGPMDMHASNADA